jgi:hypothetical protein
MLNGNKNI